MKFLNYSHFRDTLKIYQYVFLCKWLPFFKTFCILHTMQLIKPLNIPPSSRKLVIFVSFLISPSSHLWEGRVFQRKVNLAPSQNGMRDRWGRYKGQIDQNGKFSRWTTDDEMIVEMILFWKVSFFLLSVK